MDAEQHRAESRERWGRAAAGWSAQREQLRRFGMPATRWLIDAIGPQPGQRLLDLAAGTGEVGLLAAELVQPGGTVIVSDGAEAMVAAARSRAAELDVGNAEFRQLELEWIDLETASVDGVLCRWGYMLVPDAAAALRETRRVLRPGGRLALAAWAEPERNLWAALPARTLVELELAPPPDPAAPTMFSFADPAAIENLLDEAGFAEVEIDAVELEQHYADAEAWWAQLADLSPNVAEVAERIEAPMRKQILERLALGLEPYAAPGGGFTLPALTWVASATA